MHIFDLSMSNQYCSLIFWQRGDLGRNPLTVIFFITHEANKNSFAIFANKYNRKEWLSLKYGASFLCALSYCLFFPATMTSMKEMESISLATWMIDSGLLIYKLDQVFLIFNYFLISCEEMKSFFICSVSISLSLFNLKNQTVFCFQNEKCNFRVMGTSWFNCLQI